MINLKTGSHFRDLTKKDAPMTRRNVLTGLGGIIAAGCAPSIALGAARIVSRDALAGPANASVGGAARGMMRCVGAHLAMMSEKKEDNRWAQEVMDKTYPTTDIIEEHHNAKYTEELTKVYGEQQ